MKRLWLLCLLLLTSVARGDAVDSFTYNPLLKQFQAVTHQNGTKPISSTGFYSEQNDDNGAGLGAQAEASFYHVVVPVTGVYRVAVSAEIYTGTTVGNVSTGNVTIKTGSATYGSATYRWHGSTIQMSCTVTADRGIGVSSAEWVGPLNAGDTVHMGLFQSDIVGAGGNSQHFLIVQQIQ